MQDISVGKVSRTGVLVRVRRIVVDVEREQPGIVRIVPVAANVDDKPPRIDVGVIREPKRKPPVLHRQPLG